MVPLANLLEVQVPRLELPFGRDQEESLIWPECGEVEQEARNRAPGGVDHQDLVRKV